MFFKVALSAFIPSGWSLEQCQRARYRDRFAAEHDSLFDALTIAEATKNLARF